MSSHPESPEWDRLPKEFFNQRYTFELLSAQEVLRVLRSLIDGPRLNSRGKESYRDVMDSIILQDPRPCVVTRSLLETRLAVFDLLDQPVALTGYITGGLQAARHHQQSLEAAAGGFVNSFIIGLEESSFIEEKWGQPPLLSLQERASTWALINPKPSIIFVIPPRPKQIEADDYYDGITQYLGVFKHPQVIFLGIQELRPEIVAAHHRRAASFDHILNIGVGQPPIHTRQLLVTAKIT